MKKKLLAILSAGILLALNQLAMGACGPCGPCNPCDPCYCSNWYVAASGSAAWHNHSKFTNTNSSLNVDYKVGGGAAASIGYIFDMCNDWDLRLEAEGVWRRNSLKNLNIVLVPGAPAVALGGHVQDIALMANLLADAPLGCDFSLYFGGGIGVTWNEFDLDSIVGFNIGNNKTRKTLFAWQIMAGLGYDICPNLTLTAGYRLFATEKRTFAGFSSKTPYTQSVDIGLRFRF